MTDFCKRSNVLKGAEPGAIVLMRDGGGDV